MTDVGFDLGVGTDEITLGRLDAKLFEASSALLARI